MASISSDQIGTTLRALAADLVAERRRVRALRRENDRLNAALSELQSKLPGAGLASAERTVCDEAAAGRDERGS